MTFQDFLDMNAPKYQTRPLGVTSIGYEMSISELEEKIRDIKHTKVDAPYGYQEERREVVQYDYDNLLEFKAILKETSWHFLKRMREEWKAESQRLKDLEEASAKVDEYQEMKIKEAEMKTLKVLAEKYNIELKES